MNLLRAICCIILFTGVADSLSIGCSQNPVIESFYYPGDKSAENSGPQTEYLIIVRKVSWMDANTLCPYYGGSQAQHLSPQVTRSFNEVEENTEGQGGGDEGSEKYNTTLAIFSSDEERNWLARMLSESNYRYEGLWIGGTRKNKTADWHWIGDRKLENNILSNSLIYENYPSWYKVDEEVTAEQNCLLFNKIGHDVPVFIPENCQLPRPFVCMRNGKKRPEILISEAGSVSIDSYRYTLYRVTADDDKECQDMGMRKLNGGGVTWRRAQFECRKRGQHLAMVLTNEAASAIADLMLKNRPSMENAWLGGRSADGSQWTWVTSGSSLSTKQSASSKYPPWLEGHPIPVPKNHHSYTKQERCLILDRHLCPEQIAPVFLDLDCDKERPFICQDGFGETQRHPKLARRTNSDNEMSDFSENKMTFQEGEEYCAERKSQIANVLNPKSLSAALDKMSELSIDHVWIGGRTTQIGDEWHWVDLAGKPLSAKDVGANAAWCFGENSDFLPKAEPNVCLNLDYEARGFPLLYGLPCNASQVVLCGGESESTADQIVPAMPEDVDTRFSFNVTQNGDATSNNNTLDVNPSTVKVDEMNNSTTVQTPIAEVNGTKPKGSQNGPAMPEDVDIRLSFNVTEKTDATSKNKTLDLNPAMVKVDEVNNSTTVQTPIAEDNGTKPKGLQNGLAMPEDVEARLSFNVTEKGDAGSKNKTLDLEPTTAKVDEGNNSTTVQNPIAEVDGTKAKGFQNGTTIPVPLESTSSGH